MLIVRAPVRISFFGGGTDLPSYYARHGGEVVSVSINKHFYVLVTEEPENRIQIISADLRVMQTLDNLHPHDVAGELQIPLAAIQFIGLDRGANIFLASEIPPQTGLGSSGAVSVCMVKALSAFTGKHFDRQGIAEAAYHINAGMLGHPGGKQDEYGSAFGGLKHIQFRADGVTVRPLDLDPVVLRELESNILLFFTGNARASATILSSQKDACTAEKADTVDALTEIKDMVREGLAMLESGELRRFGELLHRTWETKKRVAPGISNPVIDQLYDAAIANGAIGGKIAGAGGGGFLMIYAEGSARAAVSRAMRQAGAREMLFAFDHDGVTVVHDDPFFGSRTDAASPWRLVELS
ncbi:MAG TPA: GHMP kinase [Candidatus Hydrogenedentes bacterium]|nr:GHMP kinase [Candidatus Hydrogenedentota bacterium]HOS01617.1 GHMP kinase [Candidatus Hydrogenedentota bacterium]